jgi:hypothetical protein
VESGEWGIGGKSISAEDVKAMAAGRFIDYFSSTDP